jgi:hypothetical protein
VHIWSCEKSCDRTGQHRHPVDPSVLLGRLVAVRARPGSGAGGDNYGSYAPVARQMDFPALHQAFRRLAIVYRPPHFPASGGCAPRDFDYCAGNSWN